MQPLINLVAIVCLLIAVSGAGAAEKPNVLFIAVDDLNDWIGCLGGHPQARTPNIDRLAASGVLFTNAHCAAPACNPSRTAIMAGISPHRSGLYENGQKMREVLPDAELLPRYFFRHGYWSAGSGKLLHYFIDAASWDEYFPAKETENPFPRTHYPDKRPVRLLHHSDRGCQYTSKTYQQTLRTLGIACSMSRTGDCDDNAVAERFFRSLKH